MNGHWDAGPYGLWPGDGLTRFSTPDTFRHAGVLSSPADPGWIRHGPELDRTRTQVVILPGLVRGLLVTPSRPRGLDPQGPEAPAWLPAGHEHPSEEGGVRLRRAPDGRHSRSACGRISLTQSSPLGGCRFPAVPPDSAQVLPGTLTALSRASALVVMLLARGALPGCLRGLGSLLLQRLWSLVNPPPKARLNGRGEGCSPYCPGLTLALFESDSLRVHGSSMPTHPHQFVGVSRLYSHRVRSESPSISDSSES